MASVTRRLKWGRQFSPNGAQSLANWFAIRFGTMIHDHHDRLRDGLLEATKAGFKNIIIEGDNMVVIQALKGVKRFVYISAADFGLVKYILQGYYEGKRAAETELLTRFPYGGVILRPGFIYGTRRVGSVKLPLGVIGSPLEMILQHAKPLTQVPVVGPLLTPPVNVEAVAKVSVRAATDPVFPPGIVDVHGILRYSGQRKK